MSGAPYEGGLPTLGAATEPAQPGGGSAGGSSVVEGFALDAETPATAVGRYLILGRLGRGAMGIVYAAYDPKLDRKVALKIAFVGAGATRLQGRLLGEAQALAKLAHPNIVAVHDAGTLEARGPGVVFIAMELVDGSTLGQWLAATPRHVDEVLRVMLDAGEGLAAAHERGLVHRDFKPGNVMVGTDGRVRVMDFGLARAAAGVDLSEDVVDSEGIGSEQRAALEQTRSTAGTPAYMAPEQYAAEEVGPASDQFAFCVTLWEALYGQRPFAGDSAREALVSIMDGEAQPAGPAQGVPAWLRAAMLRGLAREAGERWPDMRALLHELRRGPARRRLRRRLGIVAGVGAVAGAVVLGQSWARQQALASCVAEAERVESLWPGRRAQVQGGVRETGFPFAAATLERIEPRIDDWVSAWRDARVAACRQHEVDGTLSALHHRRARGCLDARFAGVETAIADLADGRRDAVLGAAKTVMAWRDPGECNDRRRLEGDAWPHDTAWARTQEVRRALARAEARRAGRPAHEHVETLRQIVDDAGAVAWPPLEVEARLSLGLALFGAGEYDAAHAVLRRAYFAATRVGGDLLAARAGIAMAQVAATGVVRPKEASDWTDHAESALARAGSDDPVLTAELAVLRGQVQLAEARYEQASQTMRRALALQEEALAANHPAIALTLNTLANVEARRGRMAQAQAIYTRALEITERAVGTEHPDLVHPLNNLANLLVLRKEYEAAEPLYRRAITVVEASLGGDHPAIAPALGNLATVLRIRGELPEAQLHLERALAIQERALGPHDASLTATLAGLCGVQRDAGQLDAALASCERAVAIMETSRGPDHPRTAEALASLASIRGVRGEFAQARDTAQRSVEILERRLGANHPDLIEALHTLAAWHSDLGEHGKALQARTRSLTIAAATYGTDGVRYAGGLEWRAESLRQLGRVEEARDAYLEGLAIRERAAVPDRLGLAENLAELGRLHGALGESELGVAAAERALALAQELGLPPRKLAYFQFRVAELLPDEQRERARGLARVAAEANRDAGDDGGWAEMKSWLAEHPPRSHAQRG